MMAAMALFDPPPRLTVVEWAEKHRVIGGGVSPKEGPYRVANAPYQRAPQQSFTDPEVQTTVLMWASRLGKTEMLNNLEGFIVDLDPASILVVYPTLESAKKWSKEFFMPMVKSTPRLRRKIRDSRAKDADNTILSKKFPGGKISCIGTNSPSGFRQIQARVILCDEIDAMLDGKEGDPITLAFKRADNYHNSIQVLSSTPTIKGFSRIESAMEGTDHQKWFVNCPACDAEQVLSWAQVRFSFPGEDGREVVDPVRACCVCEHCKAELTDADRRLMVLNGRWKSTRPFNGVRGYWLNGLNSLFKWKKGFKSSLHQWAQDFLTAKSKGPASLKTWTNTFLCETWEEAGETISHHPLLERREPYGGIDKDHPVVPAGAIILVQTVDVQANRLEVETIGLGPDDETWGIENIVLWGNPQQPAVWTELDGVLDKVYTHESGARMKITCMVIDSGDGKTSQAVLRFVRPRTVRRVFAVKGSSTPNAALIATAKWQKKNNLRLWTVGTDTAKATIYARLAIQEPGPRYQHFPQGFGYDEEFFQQLTAESVRTEWRRGIPVREWKKHRDRNESLDKRVYALAAAEILHPIHWKSIAKSLETDAKTRAEPQKPRDYELKPAQESPKQEPVKPPPFVKQSLPARRRTGGFVGGWK